MKVCVTAKENSLSSDIDPRFGRCQFFLIIDTETMNYSVIPNNGGTDSGAGVNASQLMIDNNVETVLTGAIGPKAAAILNTANIKQICNVTGSVEQAINQIKNQ